MAPSHAKPWKLEDVPLASLRGITALLLLGLLFVVVYADPSIQAASWIRTGDPPAPPVLSVSGAWFQAVIAGVVLGLLPFLYLQLVRPGQSPLRLLGLHMDARTPRQVALGLGVALATLVALSALVFGLDRLGLFHESPSELVGDLGRVVRQDPRLIVVLPLVAGAAEEIFFRGLLLPRLGLVASSVAFALAHLTYGTVLQVVAPFALGLLYGWLYRRSRSLWLPIAAHAGFDLIQLFALYLAPAELS